MHGHHAGVPASLGRLTCSASEPACLLQSGWVLSVEVPNKVNFTRISQGELEAARFNKSAGDKQIPLKSLYMNQTLAAGHKNSATIAVLLEAPSQVRIPVSPD